jgi:hypothetical protein
MAQLPAWIEALRAAYEEELAEVRAEWERQDREDWEEREAWRQRHKEEPNQIPTHGEHRLGEHSPGPADAQNAPTDPTSSPPRRHRVRVRAR